MNTFQLVWEIAECEGSSFYLLIEQVLLKYDHITTGADREAKDQRYCKHSPELE